MAEMVAILALPVSQAWNLADEIIDIIVETIIQGTYASYRMRLISASNLPVILGDLSNPLQKCVISDNRSLLESW